MCKDADMKIIVFNMHKKDAILNAAMGDPIGTVVAN